VRRTQTVMTDPNTMRREGLIHASQGSRIEGYTSIYGNNVRVCGSSMPHRGVESRVIRPYMVITFECAAHPCLAISLGSMEYEVYTTSLILLHMGIYRFI